MVVRTIDYIFLMENKWAKEGSNRVQVTKKLDPSDLKRDGLVNEETLNPSLNHPSDHYSIAYEVLFQI